MRIITRWSQSIVMICVLCVSGLALSVPCEEDSDCTDGQICELSDCPAIACDPDDPDCDTEALCPVEGVCVEFIAGPNSQCETDADCSDGFVCAVYEMLACPACPPGEDCDDECVTESYSYCELAPCASDADCIDGWICLAQEAPCETVAVLCPEGEDCEEVFPEPCEPETTSFCAPPWAAPCETADDCGPGFDCIPEEICMGWAISDGGSAGGSGSSGGAVPTPVPDPAPDDGDDENGDDENGDDESGDDENGDDDDEGDADADPPIEVPMDPDSGEECELTGISICEPQEIPCESDSDCPTSWTCIAAPSAGVPCSFDAESGEEDCGEEEPEETMCSPSGWGHGDIFPGAAEAYNALDGVDPGTEDSVDEEKAADSEEASDGGCQGGPMPATSFVWALVLFLGACMRRRVLA